MGPVLVAADEIPDPQALAISLRVNREVRQSSHASKMIFPVAECIAVLSEGLALLPGDVIATGTPPPSASSESRRSDRGGGREDRRARQPHRRAGEAPGAIPLPPQSRSCDGCGTASPKRSSATLLSRSRYPSASIRTSTSQSWLANPRIKRCTVFPCNSLHSQKVGQQEPYC
jgi:hypothetical protein